VKLRSFEEIDPVSILTQTSALVFALLTLGVPHLPPPAPWYGVIVEEPSEGKISRRRFWHLLEESAADGTPVATLVKCWHDPKWLAAHPEHELTILRSGLMNAVKVAQAARETPAQHKISRGQAHVLIPANASAAERAHWIGKLEGRIPPGELFKPAA
jgi:hypothetical protein